MKPPAFEYADPATVDEVMALLGEHGDSAKILAGGQSLMPMLNLRLLRPSFLVDINRTARLSFIEARGDELLIGAMTRQRTIETSGLVAENCPLLREAMPFIAHFQIRNRGTIGGSLSHADPAAELPTVVSALGGSVVLRSPRGERVLSADRFYTGYLSTALAPDELMTEIRLPFQRPGTGWAFTEVSRRHGDFALAAAAACIALDGKGRCTSARIVLAGVHAVPFRHPGGEKALVGTMLTKTDVEAASALLASELDPQTDLHASSHYRKQAARVLSVRAIQTAAARARGNTRVEP